jgi:hypothetical protein
LHPKTKVANKKYRYLGLNTFESKDYEGNTVMHISVSHGSVNCIKVFLAEFADLMMENGDYYKPLELIYDRNTRDFFYSYFEKLQQQSEKLRQTNTGFTKVETRVSNERKPSEIKPTTSREMSKLLSKPTRKGGIESEKVPPYYICSNWFIKNNVFGYTTEKLSCCNRRGYLTLKSDYLKRLKPSLKVLYNLINSNQPSLKNINFAFKI